MKILGDVNKRIEDAVGYVVKMVQRLSLATKVKTRSPFFKNNKNHIESNMMN